MQPSCPPNTHSDGGKSELLFIGFPGNAPVPFPAHRSSDVGSQGPNPQLPEWTWTVVAAGPEDGTGVVAGKDCSSAPTEGLWFSLTFYHETFPNIHIIRNSSTSDSQIPIT